MEESYKKRARLNKGGADMAVSKQYKEYIEDCFSRVGQVRIRNMMGGYLVYYRDKLVGDICNDIFLVKRTETSDRLLAECSLDYPYEGSKTLMWVVEEPENAELLRELFAGMFEELPAPKAKKK